MVWKLTEREAMRGVKKSARVLDLTCESGAYTPRANSAWRELRGPVPRKSWKFQSTRERQYGVVDVDAYALDRFLS